MIDAKRLDDMAKQLAQAVPESIKQFGQDAEQNFRSVLQGCFAKLDFVTREEFDAQTEVLARTRERLEALEQQVVALEQELRAKTKS